MVEPNPGAYVNLDLGWLAVVRQVLEAHGVEAPVTVADAIARDLRNHQYGVLDCANYDERGQRTQRDANAR